MAIDLDKIKAKLNNLSQTNNRKNYQWKPQPGKQQVRIVPYKHQPDNPFIELYFHYGINNRTYLSPKSFGRPDPIVEFAEKLTRSGDKDDYRMGRSLMPKMRTFVPVLVRGEEAEGVRFWGFGKEVYQELYNPNIYCIDSSYCLTNAYKIDSTETIIEMINSDGAGGYAVILIFNQENCSLKTFPIIGGY